MIDFFSKGGPVMYALLICSVLSLTIIIERFVFWLKLRMERNRRILNIILRLAEKGELNNAIKLCKQSDDKIARVLLEGIKNYNYNFVNALEATATNEINSMKSKAEVVIIWDFVGVVGFVFTIVKYISN